MRAFAGLFALLLLGSNACSGGERDGDGGRRPRAAAEEEPASTPRSRSRLPGAHTNDSPDAAPDPAKLVYVVSRDKQLFSFDPRQPGLDAYRFVGKLDCKSRGTPQSMAVDRGGIAWVFYSSMDTGELFHVNVRDASCKPTPYRHGKESYQLGMGFTAVEPGSPDERLYVVSPSFGLASVAMPSLGLRKTGKLVGGAELTGGADAKLFHFGSHDGRLSEVDLKSHALKPLHTFFNLQNVGAWAFARYAGRFYLFTAENQFTPSRTTMFDPKTNKESIRDENVGFTIVGAGQSTKVPPTDGGSEVSGEPPPP